MRPVTLSDLDELSIEKRILNKAIKSCVCVCFSSPELKAIFDIKTV